MKKVNLFCPINSLGYGVVSYNVWKELNKTDDVTLWPVSNQISTPIKMNEEQTHQFQIDIMKQNEFDPTAPCLKIWHENHLGERIGVGPLTNLSFFEVNKFDARRKSHLKSADRIAVPSLWAAAIVIDQLKIKPADEKPHIVPMGVDRTIFNETFNNTDPHKCIFFNCGKWEVRKGHDILHKAFKDAFPNVHDVELWMMADNPFLNENQKSQWESSYKGDYRIKLIEKVQYQDELARIMARINCGVFPARAEGWNLEILELMSMGKQVIATDYSAHTEFCNKDNCNLVKITEEEPMFDGYWFTGDNGTWASLEGDAYDELINRLREVYKRWQSDREMPNEAGIETAKELSWEKTAASLLEITTA
jgi:glycosyltransferase involved in cell wall biosynthesis